MENYLTERIKNMNLPENFKVEITNYLQIHPHTDEKKDAKIVQILIGQDYSFLDFTYDPETKALDNVEIHLKQELRGKGFGKGLLRIMEELGKQLGCRYARFQINQNPDFWKHMGYNQRGNYWEKRLN